MSTPNFYAMNSDPGSGNSQPTYHQGDIWLNQTTKRFFQCNVDTMNAAVWSADQIMLNVRDFGAQGVGGDDTASINAAIAAGRNYPGAIVYFPAGTYGISDRKAQQNIQLLTLNSGSNFSFHLTVSTNCAVAGTSTPYTQTTGPISYVQGAGNAQMTANNIQAALRALTNVGNNVNVSVVTTPPPTNLQQQFQVAFGAGFGSAVPAMFSPDYPPIAGGGAPVVVHLVQSGAALTIANTNGVHLKGDGGNVNAGASKLVWYDAPTNSNGGVMLDLLGSTDVVIEDLAFFGTSSGTGFTYAGARVGILFPFANGTGGASRLLCRGLAFANFFPVANSTPFPTATAGVQIGFTVTDSLCDQTKFLECQFWNCPTGILLTNNNGVGHQIQAIGMFGVTNGVWAQAGGNLQWSGGILETCPTILRLGLWVYPFQGGGPNASNFLLENLRTEPAGLSNDVVVVDATALGGATSIMVQGWNDVTPVNDGTPALRLGSGATLTMRDSTVNRSAAGSLAQESAFVSGVSVTPPGGAGYTSAPTVQFSGGGGSGAAATATVAGGVVTGVWMTNGGSGYTSTPTVTLVGGGYTTQATATASLSAPPLGWPPILRLENVIVPYPTPYLCSFPFGAAVVDVVSERVGNNVGSARVSTIVGRPRYSPLDFAILQQLPKNFWDLGDVGLIAPNRGTNAAASSTPPYNDAYYAISGPNNIAGQQLLTQNVQGVVLNDGIGAFNTRAPGSSVPTGSALFLNPNSKLGVAPASGLNWSFSGAVRRNTATSGAYPHAIFSNLSGSTGFEIRFNTADQLEIAFGTQVFTGVTAFNFAGILATPIYFLFVVIPGVTRIYLYTCWTGSIVNEFGANGKSYTGTLYADNSVNPLIGKSTSTGLLADLQIGRIASWDAALASGTLLTFFNAGASIGQGR